MLETKLSSEEKRRLERCMSDVKISHVDFITRQKVRIIVTRLGGERPSRVLLSDALDILKDDWPFKTQRIRKLINGRRPRQ